MPVRPSESPILYATCTSIGSHAAVWLHTGDTPVYEAPFTGLHAGGPDGLFANSSEMIAGIFQAIEATQPVVQSSAG